MFLRAISNPHDNGRIKRAVVFEAAAGQYYAVDAERLHRQPALLNQFQWRAGRIIRALDAVAYLTMAAGVVASFLIVWWLFMPCVAGGVLMLATNRKTAGEIAGRAAASHYVDFMHLHDIGCLWLLPQQTRH